MSEETETISTENPPEQKEKSTVSKKKKKPEKPEWNRYIWHLTDKRREKLMELPVIPKTVKQTNKELLKKRRSRSVISQKDSKPVIRFESTNRYTKVETNQPTSKRILKSIIKNSDSTSSSRSESRAKSSSSDDDPNRRSPIKTILKRTESRNTNSSDNEESSGSKLSNRKIQFRSVRGYRDNTELRDFEAKYNSVNYGFEQMQVSPTYNKLLRSLRANLENYNRCRYSQKRFLDEYKDILDPPTRRIIITSKACRRNNFMNHFYDGDTMTGAYNHL